MLSRSTKIALATVGALGLFTALVAVNARLSWRPVVVDFSSAATPSANQHIPIAWQGNKLWLLSTPEVTTQFDHVGDEKQLQWKIARNWNRVSTPIMRATRFDFFQDPELATLCPDKDEFVISQGRSRLELWQNGRFRRALESGFINKSGVHVSQARLPSLSPDGTHVAVCSLPRPLHPEDTEETHDFCPESIVVLDVRTGKRTAVYDGQEGSFSDFAWSPDSRNVAGITSNGWVFVLDTKTNELKLKFRAHQLLGAQIAWSPNGKVLATATNSRLGAAPTCLCFHSPQSSPLVVSRNGGTTRLDKDSKIEFQKNVNGQIAWRGHDERLLKRFDARTGKPVGRPLALATGAVDLAFSPDGKQIAIGEHGFALVLDADTLTTVRHLTVPLSAQDKGLSNDAPVCVAWSPDGATLATATQTSVVFWRAK